MQGFGSVLSIAGVGTIEGTPGGVAEHVSRDVVFWNLCFVSHLFFRRSQSMTGSFWRGPISVIVVL